MVATLVCGPSSGEECDTDDEEEDTIVEDSVYRYLCLDGCWSRRRRRIKSDCMLRSISVSPVATTSCARARSLRENRLCSMTGPSISFFLHESRNTEQRAEEILGRFPKTL